MRFKPFIVWMIVALMVVQQTVIASAVCRDDAAPAILPVAGSVYVNASRDTRLLRVTDQSDALSARVISTAGFNADATRFVVNLDGTATLYRFDAATMTMVKEGPLFDHESLDLDSLQWSATDADTVFGLDTANGALRLAAYDTVTRRLRVMKDFSGQLGRGEAALLSKPQAADTQFAFAWREAGASAWRDVIVWSRVNDSIYSFDLNDPAAGVSHFTSASFNQSGEALAINGATTRVWRFAGESQQAAVEIAATADAEISAKRASGELLNVASATADTLPRQGRSRDGSLALFNASAGGSRQDVFIAAVPPSAASSLVWTNLVNCSAHDNSVQKTSGKNDADDASATSLQTVAKGDAYVEFTALNTDKERICGLSNSNAIHEATGDINFAIKLTSSRKAFFTENGVVKGKVKYKPGNVFRISVESNIAHYYKNGALVYSSQTRPKYPMLVAASLVNTMASVDNVMVYGAGFGSVISISPETATVEAGQTTQFKALITSAQVMGMKWEASGGAINSNGLYTAPTTPGTYTVTATLVADPPAIATAIIIIGPGDTRPPVISAIASSGVTTSAATVTWSTNEASDSTVEYGLTTSYGATAANTARVTSHSLILSGLVAGTTYHYRVKSRDAAGNLATSSDNTFTTSASGGGGGGSAPVITLLSTGSVTTSGAAVTWTTDKISNTQIDYGATAGYGSSTTLNSAMVTAHSVTLSGLTAGAAYHFRVRSRDAAGTLTVSGDQTFMTASTASGGGGGGGGGGTDPLKTDKNVYAEPPPPALPAAGGTWLDPVFGTTVMRVTDQNDGSSNFNSYSYWPSLNRNSTRLMIFVNGGNPMLYAFDPVNFRISGKRALFTTPLPGGGYPWNDDVIWSGLDPDVIFCHSGMKIYSYNVVANSYTLIKDFTGQAAGANLYQMAKSIDDNAFGFTVKDANWSVVGYLGWQRAQNNLYTAQTSAVDEVEVDKSGQYLYVLTGDQGTASAIEGKVVNLQTRQVVNLTDGAPDFSPGHKDCGQGTVIGHDNWNNALNMRRLATPHQFSTVISFGNDWSQGDHISYLGDNEGWLLVSMFVANTLPNSGLYKNELFMVSTDGQQRVRRVAHHHSTYRDYYDMPRANISRDGQFAIFTSNWGSSSRRDVFIVKIPPPPASGSGGDSTPPVISAVAEANVTATGATINWATNEASNTQVDYGTTASYGSSTTLNSTMATGHNASLSGFAANTTYHFRVRSRDVAGNLAISPDMLFTTPGGGSGGGGGGGGGGAVQNIAWTSVVNCTASGNTLQKTGGRDDSADAGARSQQTLVSGGGYLEFTAQETNKLRFCGLALNTAGTDFAGIDFAIKLTDYSVAEVREANVYKGETAYSSGDVFRISVEGGVVKYSRNGTVFYTSSRPVSYPLIADTSFIPMGGSIANAKMAATTGVVAINEAPQPLAATATLLALTPAATDALAPSRHAGSPLMVVANREAMNEVVPMAASCAIALRVAFLDDRRMRLPHQSYGMIGS